jgi:hypothetical protein
MNSHACPHLSRLFLSYHWLSLTIVAYTEDWILIIGDSIPNSLIKKWFIFWTNLLLVFEMALCATPSK